MADSGQSEWKRLPGRRFENRVTGEVLSRRQYDKRYGALARGGFQSYEAKAKANYIREGPIRQLLKPARGRVKYRGPEYLREREAARRSQDREALRLQRHILKRIKAYGELKHHTYKTINDRNFKPGIKGRKFRVEFTYEGVAGFLDTAKRNKNLFGYLVGLDFIDLSTGVEGSFYVIAARGMTFPFTPADWDTIENKIEEKLYHYSNNILFLGAFVYLLQKHLHVEKQREKIRKEKTETIQRRTSKGR